MKVETTQTRMKQMLPRATTVIKEDETEGDRAGEDNENSDSDSNLRRDGKGTSRHPKKWNRVCENPECGRVIDVA